MLFLWKPMEKKINLSRTHYSLPNKWIIKNQTQYETAQFLMEQEALGLNPSYFITFHYYHPDEVMKKENDATNKCSGLWKENPKDKFIRNRRLDEDDLIKDVKQIKNVILKQLYGIKRLNQSWKYKFPNLLFFYEMGKSKIKYHTHLLLPNENLKYDNPKSLEFIFNNKIRKSRKCFSNWKKIDVEEVNNVRGALSYCNKETNLYNYSIDYHNSNFIKKR